MGTTRLALGASITAFVVAVSGIMASPAGAAPPPAHVLAEELSSPKGLAVNLAGDPVVAQGAFGAPGPVLVYPLRGRGRGTPFPVTDPVNLVDVAVSPLDDTGWAIGMAPVGDDVHAVLYHQLADGTVEMPLDITAYQATDLDPYDQDVPPAPEESNPYGLTVLASGDALVADAAGNDLIRVTPAGDRWTVARFAPEETSTDHLPAEFGLPPTIDAESVPTSVAIGPDGAAYVGELKGFPFRSGTSHVWRVDPDAVDALCSVETADPDCSVHLGGFTAIHDLAFNPNNGRLYVYELAVGGVFAFEEAFGTGDFPPAVLLEVTAHRRTELAVGQLSEPGGVAVARDGKVFVTDGVFTGGRLLRVVG